MRTVNNEKGFILIGVLIIMAALLALGAIATHSAQIELQITSNQVRAQQALANAEAGIDHAVSLTRSSWVSFNTVLTGGGTGVPLSALGTPTTLNGASYVFYSTGPGSTDGYYLRALDNHDEATIDDPTKDVDRRIKLQARGRMGDTERVVEVLLRSTTVPGFYGRDFITISGGVNSFPTTSSYSSSNGACNPSTTEDHGDITTNGNITLSGGTNVHGDATAGGTITAGAVITGTQTTNAPPLTFPSGAACSPLTGLTGVSGDMSKIKIDGGATAGYLDVSGGGTAILAPGSYCWAGIKVGGGSTLQVTGLTTITSNGPISFSGGSLVNTTCLPSNLTLISAYQSSNSDSNALVLSGGTGAYMTVYAPTAAVTLSGGSNFYGAIVSESLNDSGGTDLHYDTALNLGVPVAGQWHEARGL
jgi:PilX N-terminal